MQRKKRSQPSQIKTCGSTFKNISKEKKAWMLIKESGCENYEEGDAVISKKHCNFFINKGKACLLYTSPSPRDRTRSRMPSSA